MKFELLVTKEAEQDACEAYDFYESQQAGLGDRFHDEVAMVLKAIQSHPQRYPRAERTKYFRARTNVFPFCLYYCVVQKRVIVVAVHDARRDPQRWRERAI